MADAEVRRRVGRYGLLKKVGQGAFGEVWLARDTGLDRSVAIKLPKFSTKDAEDDKRVRRFLNEVKAAASLRHPNIVPIFDAGQIDDQHYIATEYVEGIPLSEINNREKSPVHWAVMIVCKLAEAVHYAHEQSIVHRDIKPDNVLIDKQGEPQLLDFGLAKRVDESAAQTIDGTVMGTPGYMSPEQARGAMAEIGPASDQFSLGVTLYRLLAGRTPFIGAPASVLHQILSIPPPPLSEFVDGLHPDLEAICEKSRASDTRDRYVDCQQFAGDLRNYLAGESVIVRPMSRVKKLVRWSGGNPREATLAGLCFAVGFLSLTLSSIGWASALKSESAAKISQRLVEEETNRILDLEATLKTRVVEAAAIRDTARAAQTAEAESRKKLEAENGRLAAANAAADAALKKSQELAAQFATQESSNAELTSSVNDAKQRLAESRESNNLVVEADLKADASTSKTGVVVPEKNKETDLICEWRGEPALFTHAGEKTDRVVGSVGNTKRVGDISLDVSGSLVCSWESGTSSDLGIASIAASRPPISLVPIFYSAQSSTSKADLSRGAVWNYSGSSAIDKNQNVYFVANNSCLMQFSADDQSFKLIADYSMSDVDIYNSFDPDGVYVIGYGTILRYDRNHLDNPSPEVVISNKVDKSSAASDIKIGSRRMAEFLSPNVLFADSRFGPVILDFETKKYWTFRNKSLHILCALGNGRYVATDNSAGSSAAIIELIDRP